MIYDCANTTATINDVHFIYIAHTCIAWSLFYTVTFRTRSRYSQHLLFILQYGNNEEGNLKGNTINTTVYINVCVLYCHILLYAILSHTAVCHTVTYCCVLYCHILLYAILSHAAVCYTVTYCCMLYCHILLYAILSHTAVCYTVTYCCMLYCHILLYAILSHTAVCCTVTYCCMLYCHILFEVSRCCTNRWLTSVFSENLPEHDSVKIEMCGTGYKLWFILQPTCTLLVLYISLCFTVRC
jgi:hypothetical protein